MMMLLITGSPRSGTRYVSSLLRQSGIRAFHERVGSDGSVSSLFAVDDFWYPGNKNPMRRSSFDWTHVFHQVRHPLDTIASLAAMERPEFWHWTQVHTGLGYEEDDAVVHAAKFWVKWNELAEKLNPEWTYQIESDFWDEMCDRIGIGRCEIPEVAENGASRHGKISWDDLGSARGSVEVLAERYGY